MLNLNPFLNAADAGAGGGSSSQGAGSQGGAQGGGSQGVGSQGSGSQGSVAPVSLSDDTPITVDGKTVSWKDYRSNNFVPRAEHDQVKNLTKQEIERNIRALASKLNLSPQQLQHMQRQNQPAADPLAGFRDMPLIDGANMAKALEGTLGPVAQAVAQMQQKIQQQDQMLKKLGAGVGVFAKDKASQERSGRINTALSALGDGYDAKDPFLNEIAQDILDAWDFGDKPDEFNTMLANRLKAAEQWVRAKDKKALEVAKSRRFVRPGGSGNPSGAATPFKNQKFAIKEAADMLFGQQQSGRT